MIFEALIEVFLVLANHPQKAVIYFCLAVISGFLISATWLVKAFFYCFFVVLR